VALLTLLGARGCLCLGCLSSALIRAKTALLHQIQHKRIVTSGTMTVNCLVQSLSSTEGSKVNPGSPLGQPWVPDFWRTSVGPRRKLGNVGPCSTLVRPGTPYKRSWQAQVPAQNLSTVGPSDQFSFLRARGNQIKLSTFDTVAFRV